MSSTASTSACGSTMWRSRSQPRAASRAASRPELCRGRPGVTGPNGPALGHARFRAMREGHGRNPSIHPQERNASMLMSLIPTRMHAVMDYLGGIVLIAAPWILGFADDSTTAATISVLAGLALLGTSAITSYEGGFLAHAISMRMHLMMDGLLGIVLVIS